MGRTASVARLATASVTTGGDAGWPTMGDELREARRVRGLTLDDAQRATRIARHYLEALEAEDFAALPAPVFARGFLRSYAQYLGLDASALIAKFPGEPRPPEALPTAGTPDRAVPAGGGFGPGANALEPIPAVEQAPPSVRLGPWLVAAFVILVVLAGVVAVVTLGEDTPTGSSERTTVPGVAAPAELEDVETVPDQPTLTGTPLPDLTMETASQAELFVRRSGAPFVVVEVYDGSPQGTVLEQHPPPGVSLEQGDVITLVVSRGPAPSPITPPAAEDSAGASEGRGADAPAGQADAEAAGP